MASELPDALEKLALKAERSESEQGTSLSKYFGQPDNTDDIFDTIVKPSRSVNEEPKVNFFKSPSSTPVKEDNHQNYPPTFAFKKGEQESEEPKIFSYFSQPPVATGESNKNADATEFFDHISQLASKSREPIEITTSGFQLPSTDSNSSKACPQSVSVTEISDISPHSNEVPTVPDQSRPSSSNLPANIVNIANIVSPAVTRPLFTPPQGTPYVVEEPGQAVQTWSKTQERASSWWIPNETVRLWLQSSGSVPSESFRPSCPGLLNSVELVLEMNLPETWTVKLVIKQCFLFRFQVDPIKDLLRHFDGEAAAAERQTLTADLVTQDTEGIRDLIKVLLENAQLKLCQ
jgi:hypothetical protein